MRRGFTRISLQRYADQHVRHNPGTDRRDLVARLRRALEAHRRGERCRCGARIWVIGSAEVGLGCFTCITGEAFPDDDHEIDEAVDRNRVQDDAQGALGDDAGEIPF